MPRKHPANNWFDIDIVNPLKERKIFTPDFVYLRNTYQYVPCFIYGNFKSLFVDNKLLLDSKFLGRARTLASSFVMLEDYRDAIVMKETRESPLKGFVKGEAWAVSLEDILVMDKVTKNDSLFYRHKTNIMLLEQTVDTKSGPKNPTLEAYMYLGRADYWDEDPCVQNCMAVSELSNNKMIKFYNWSGVASRFVTNSVWDM